MPKRMPSPSYQERVLTTIDSQPSRVWTTRELAEQTGLTSSQTGGAVGHLVKKGLVAQPRSGVGEYWSKKYTQDQIAAGSAKSSEPAPVNGRYQTGTLLEVAGYTEAGTLVLRNLDTQALVPMMPYSSWKDGR